MNQSRAQALNNLEFQIAQYETDGVRSMYEMAARDAGASWEEIYAIYKRYNCEHGYYGACGQCKYKSEARHA